MEALEGRSGEALGHLMSSGLAGGDLATFRALTPDRRRLTLRLLDSPTTADFDELGALDGSQAFAEWIGSLPPYQRAPDGDPDEMDD